MKSRLLTAFVVVGVLAISGAGFGRLAEPAWAAARERQPALRLSSSITAAGQGLTLALLGGFRALVADALWVRMYVLWERHDMPATQSLIQLVTAIDPRPVYFWINGARILAHDFAMWRLDEAGGYERVGPSVEERINRLQGTLALEHLRAAMVYHPNSPDLWIEKANIELRRMNDVAAAADSYRQAWEQPNGPYYAARLYAELLRRQGRKAEALDWLVRLHPSLPPNDDGAARDTVLARIRELESELGVPASSAYQAPR